MKSLKAYSCVQTLTIPCIFFPSRGQRSNESSCSNLRLAQLNLGFWSVNSKVYVRDITCFRGSVCKHSDSKGVTCLDQSGLGVGLVRKCLICTYDQGNVPVVILAANLDWVMRWSFSKKCSARVLWCFHNSVRNDEELPGVKSGLWRSGVMGPNNEETLFLRQASWKEISVS